MLLICPPIHPSTHPPTHASIHPIIHSFPNHPTFHYLWLLLTLLSGAQLDKVKKENCKILFHPSEFPLKKVDF